MEQLGDVAAVTITVLLMKLFADCAVLTPLGSTPLRRPGSNPHNSADVCGFLNLVGSQRFLNVSMVHSLSFGKLFA